MPNLPIPNLRCTHVQKQQLPIILLQGVHPGLAEKARQLPKLSRGHGLHGNWQEVEKCDRLTKDCLQMLASFYVSRNYSAQWPHK